LLRTGTNIQEGDYPNPSSAVNSTTPLDFRASGLSGAGLVLLAARRVLRTIQRNCRKQGFPTCKRREARASRQERLRMRMRMRRSLWVSRCTPGLLLRIWVIGAEESRVELQGQVGSESRNSDRVSCGQKLEHREI